MDEPNIVRVPVGDGAVMVAPTNAGAWRARYATHALNPYDAAEVMDSYLYLVCECSQKEAWRRLRLMRAALVEQEPK